MNKNQLHVFQLILSIQIHYNNTIIFKQKSFSIKVFFILETRVVIFFFKKKQQL